MKHIIEYFHWSHVISPLISIVLAYFIHTDEKIIEYIIITLPILINLLIIFIQSYRQRTNEKNLGHSFIFDELLPNKTGKELNFNAQIVIIQHEKDVIKDDNKRNSTSFYLKLSKVFNSKIGELSKLTLNPVICKSSEIITKKTLDEALKGADAVVVVRTEELENNSWIYEELDSWAYDNSSIPILYTKLPPNIESKSTIPQNYLSISDDSISLPWKLMQRANERGVEWRDVAKFNRFVATNFILLLVMSILIGHFFVTHQEQEQERLNRLFFLNEAKLAKKQYSEITLINQDDFELSYWFRHEGKIKQLVKTEDKITTTPFEDDFTSVIGCGFNLENHGTKWQKGEKDIEVWFNDNYENKFHNSRCSFGEENGTLPYYLACYAFNSTNPMQSKYTVGVCLLTRKGTPNILVANYEKFLRIKAEEFFNLALPLIEDNKLVPLPETKKDK